MCKIALLENYSLFGSGIKSLLAVTKEFKVVAEGASADSLVLQLRNEIPDVIVIDMLHCYNAGVKTVKKTRKYFPRVPLLLITSEDYFECFNDYLRFGVKGFVFKNDSPDDLVSAIKKLHSGKMYFRKNVRKVFSDVSSFTKPLRGIHQREQLLTEREIAVLKLFCDGLTYKEVGVKLFISPRTVESHKKNIMTKLNVASTAEMIKYATRNRFTTN